MRSRIAVAALLCALVGAGSVPADEGKTSPAVAREEAESNAKTPAGRRYESALESSLDTWLRKAIERCAKSASREDAVSFEVLVRIGGSGDAEEVLFEPATSVGKCAERDFLDAKYPSPPRAGWWVEIPVQLK